MTILTTAVTETVSILPILYELDKKGKKDFTTYQK